MGHIQSILRIIFESNSVECAFLSVIALTTTVVTFFQVFRFLIDRGTGFVSIDAVQEQIMKNLNFTGLFNLIANGAGVCIPLALALVTGFIISFRIVLTTGYLLKNKVELLKNLSPTLMILMFYFLFKNVRNILGPIQAYITIGIIGFYGFYFMAKK